LKIVFFGTPSFAASVLEFLHNSSIKIAALVTQPDRPQGRKLLLTASATKQLAHLHSWDFPILQPEKASDPQFLETLENLNADRGFDFVRRGNTRCDRGRHLVILRRLYGYRAAGEESYGDGAGHRPAEKRTLIESHGLFLLLKFIRH
jgi:hypothetical protein